MFRNGIAGVQGAQEMATVSRVADSFHRHIYDPGDDWFEIEARLKGDAQDPALADGFTIVAAGLMNGFYLEFADAFNLCESPIERLMFTALWGTGLRMGGVFFRCSRWAEDEVRGPGRMDQSHFIIQPQAQIGGFRVDFLVEYRSFLTAPGEPGPRQFRSRYTSSSLIVVECDGHDFHEKTKEQAKRDKFRDRELSKLGHQVFHYTGSEVWNDVYLHAKESLEELQRKAVAKQ